ncbi:MAG: hypothetical protein WCE79_16085 [Xanthobacteraceae bacterium]
MGLTDAVNFGNKFEKSNVAIVVRDNLRDRREHCRRLGHQTRRMTFAELLKP